MFTLHTKAEKKITLITLGWPWLLTFNDNECSRARIVVDINPVIEEYWGRRDRGRYPLLILNNSGREILKLLCFYYWWPPPKKKPHWSKRFKVKRNDPEEQVWGRKGLEFTAFSGAWHTPTLQACLCRRASPSKAHDLLWDQRGQWTQRSQQACFVSWQLCPKHVYYISVASSQGGRRCN